ncbi:hypothetical protein AB0M29_00690 [Streptomyces sp. NPDC051976]|uniref:hypothetical protein n=1 Tax=Streptomyces sp. NPDC051976 TaxID=3154947 RepID=UPI003426470B
MSAERDSARFVAKVTACVTAAMPGAVCVELDSVVEDAVSLAGYDEADKRSAEEVTAALEEAVRADGWEAVRSVRDGMTMLKIAREGLGGGVFSVQESAIAFTGIPGYGNARPEAAPSPSPDPASPGAPRRAVSAEMRGAIRAAAPRAVHPRDEFEDDGGVRVAGWDPQERQSNEELLAKADGYLTAHGWQVSPDMWEDSEDRSAVVRKAGVASGWLHAANGGLTFVGRLAD